MAVFLHFLRLLEVRMPPRGKKKKNKIQDELSRGSELGAEREKESWFIPVVLVKGPDSKE